MELHLIRLTLIQMVETLLCEVRLAIITEPGHILLMEMVGLV